MDERARGNNPFRRIELTRRSFQLPPIFCLAPIFCHSGVCSRFDIRKACSWFCLPSCRGTSKSRLRRYSLPRTSVNPASYCRTSLLRAKTSGFEEEEKEVWGGVRLRGGAWKVCCGGMNGNDEESPGEMARKGKKGYDACCAQGSSSPCDDGGRIRTNKVRFASSSSRTYRRTSNSSAQNLNTKCTDSIIVILLHLLDSPHVILLFSESLVSYHSNQVASAEPNH
jgi:hypothetical protein